MNGILRIQKNTILHAKRIAVFLICCFLLSNLTGCRTILYGCRQTIQWNPSGDWAYEDLPNGYVLIRVDFKTVVLCAPNYISEPEQEDSLTNIRVGTYISAFCSNDRYIAVRWTNPDEIDFDRLAEYDFSAAKYVLVNSKNDRLYGPYDNETEFMQQIEVLDTGELFEWVDVQDIPNILRDKYYD